MHRRALLAALPALGLAPLGLAAPARANVGRFAAAAGYSAQRFGVSFLVARYGVILAEDYPNGGGHGTPWRIGAGARSFAPLLAASLVDDGMLSLDEPVALTLGDWGAHPLKSRITVRGLLNGSSGIAFGPRDPITAAVAMALEPQDEPGRRFIEDAAPYVLLVEIAKRKLAARGRIPDPLGYLIGRTLSPIGCNPVSFARGEDGSPRFDDGAAVTARGWAMAGELIRRAGLWRAGQLVDEDAIREAQRSGYADARAGMGLWIAAGGRGQAQPAAECDLWRMSPPAPADLAMSAGRGGQRLYIIPSHNLVVVRQSGDLDARGFSDAMFLSLLLREA